MMGCFSRKHRRKIFAQNFHTEISGKPLSDQFSTVNLTFCYWTDLKYLHIFSFSSPPCIFSSSAVSISPHLYANPLNMFQLCGFSIFKFSLSVLFISSSRIDCGELRWQNGKFYLLILFLLKNLLYCRIVS